MDSSGPRPGRRSPGSGRRTCIGAEWRHRVSGRLGAAVQARDPRIPGTAYWACRLGLFVGRKTIGCLGEFGEGQALIWEAHTGRHLGSLTNIPGGSGLLKFSPRDTWLAARLDEGTTCGFQIGLWKQPWTACERLLAKPGHHVTDMAFSPDEQFLATAGEDGSVCLWAVRTGRRVADLKGQLNCFTAVAWSPSGDRLLGGGEDGTITIWDTTSHQEVGRLLGHQKPIRGLAFSQDGGGIVSVSLESLRIWRASPLDSFVVLTPAVVEDAGSPPAQGRSPSKVKGAGVYQHYVHRRLGDVFPSDESVGRFAVNIDPQANEIQPTDPVVSVSGPALEAFWGGPVVIRDQFQDWIASLWDQNDPKPGQTFIYRVTHPVHGEVAVCVYVHDNVTPGHNKADPQWSDWFGIYVERWDGGNRHYNGVPDWQSDDLFTGMGILTDGDVIDYRK
jgi:hypothetical protein